MGINCTISFCYNSIFYFIQTKRRMTKIWTYIIQQHIVAVVTRVKWNLQQDKRLETCQGELYMYWTDISNQENIQNECSLESRIISVCQ